MAPPTDTVMKKTLYLLLPLLLLATACNAKKEADAVEAPKAHFPEGSPNFGTDYVAALAQAKKENKPIILVFSAAWCGPCQSMKKTVYPSKEVTPLHDKFIWAYLDIDEEANGAPAQKYKVEVIPHIQFLAPDGKNLGSSVGGTSASEFAGILQKVLAKSKS